MRLWLRARHVPQIVLALIAIGLLRVSFGNGLIEIPLFMGSYGVAGWLSLLTIGSGIVVGSAFSSKATGTEARVRMRVAVLDCALLLTLTLVGLFVLWSGSNATGGSGGVTALAGKLLVAVGLTTLGNLVAGTSGVLITTVAGIVSIGYGYDAPAGPYVRVFALDGDPVFGWLLGVALTAAAVVVMLRRQVRIEFDQD